MLKRPSSLYSNVVPALTARLTRGLVLMTAGYFLSSSQGVAHPMSGQAVDYPFVAAFDRFYAPEDDEDHLAEGGLLLLSEMNCVACHTAPAGWKERLAERPKIALDAVGSRMSADDLWLFIRSPQHQKKGTLMPGMFAGEDRDPKVVEALVTYLSSLKKTPKQFPKGDLEKGRELYHTVGCIACHSPATVTDYKPVEAPPGLDVATPTFPSVPIVLADKYDVHALAAFLQDPLSIRHAGRMPSTELSDQEAADIATYLQLYREKSVAQERESLSLPPQTVEDGRKQFVAQSCTACHDSGAKDTFAPTKALADLKPDQGCLSTQKKAGVPDFGLNQHQLRAVNLALQLIQKQSQPVALTALQKVDSFLMKMNCYACHEWRGTGGLEEAREQYFTVYDAAAHSLGELGRVPPKLDVAGRKLTKKWMEKLLWGEHGGVRTYMAARMPRFGKENSEAFIPDLAEVSKREEPITIDTSGLLKHHRGENGRVLLGTGVGGMGCVSCHGLKDRKSLGVPVINLTHTVDRLQPEYFKELLLNPQAVQPGTLMPPLFMGRKKADQDIEQIWTYLKELDQSRLPEGLLLTGEYELKPEKEGHPMVFRTFLEGAGMEAVAIGFPQGLHVAFDAYEVRWALAWKGRFLDAMTTWEERAMTPAKPLGDAQTSLPALMPVAKMTSPADTWSDVYGSKAGYVFKGYRMGKDGVPTFLYEDGDLKMEDVIRPAADGQTLQRTLTVRGKGDDWYFHGIAKDAVPVKVIFHDGVAVLEETIRL